MEYRFACPTCGATNVIAVHRAGSMGPCGECNADISFPPFRFGENTVIGGFALDECIGAGSMGDVYLATQLSMGRKVAVKVLPGSIARDENSVSRFLNEVQTCALLEHPNIITAFDAGEDNGIYFMAMSFVDGHDLEGRSVPNGDFDEAQVLNIAKAVAGALQYAWDEHQILHRDVKPANIMLDRFNNVRLMDMGISKACNNDAAITRDGYIVGTPQYMSHEQAWIEAEVDFRADQYSLGATLYDLLTGKTPYEGNARDVIDKLKAPEPIPSPRSVNPEVSEQCERLVQRMMAPKADARYDSWGALIADLDAVQKGTADLAPIGGSGAGNPMIREEEAKTLSSGSKEEPVGTIQANDVMVIQPKARDENSPSLRMKSKDTPPQNAPEPVAEGDSDRPSTPGDERKPQLATAPKVLNTQSATPAEAEDEGGGINLATVAAIAIIGLIVVVVAVAMLAGGKEENKPPKVAAANTVEPLPTPTVDPALERQQIQAEIDSRVAAAVAKLKPKSQAVAKQLKLDWPVPPQKLSIAKVKLVADSRARTAVAKRFPPDKAIPKKDPQEIAATARTLYAPFKIGDAATVKVTKSGEEVTGVIKMLSNKKVLIGDQWVAAADMDEDSRVRFSNKAAKARVRDYVQAELAKHDNYLAEVKSYTQKTKDSILKKTYAEAGYTFRDGKWQSQEKLLNDYIAAMVAKRKTELVTQLTREVYTEHGYRKSNGQWTK